MISLFVALYSLLCLCTAVNTSDIKELHLKTVTSGENVTIECNTIKDKNNLRWYRQSFGKVPQFLAKGYGQNNYTFADGFKDNRFSITLNEHQFNLNIKNMSVDDVGEYFCGEIEGNNLKFTSGTRLQFEEKEMKLCPTPGPQNKITASGTHQDSYNTSPGEMKLCPTHGPENNITCSGTHQNPNNPECQKENIFDKQWTIYALTAFSIISVIVIMILVGVLFKSQRKDVSSQKPEISTNQADDEDVLNYAAVSFAKKPSSSRTSRDKRHEDVYAQVQIK